MAKQNMTIEHLETLAEKANDAHRKANQAAQTALEYAREAGEYLTQAKAECKHGEWLGWLEENFEGTPRTAQRYIQVAERWPEIEANATRVSHLSLSAALSELAEPKPKKPASKPSASPTPDSKSPREPEVREFGDGKSALGEPATPLQVVAAVKRIASRFFDETQEGLSALKAGWPDKGSIASELEGYSIAPALADAARATVIGQIEHGTWRLDPEGPIETTARQQEPTPPTLDTNGPDEGLEREQLIKRLGRLRDMLASERETHAAQYQEYDQKLEQLLKQNAQLKEQHDQLEQRYADLDAQHELTSTELEHAQDEVEEAKLELAALSGQLEEAKGECERMNEAYVNLAQRYNDLQDEVERLKEGDDGEYVDLDEIEDEETTPTEEALPF